MRYLRHRLGVFGLLYTFDAYSIGYVVTTMVLISDALKLTEISVVGEYA